MFRHGARNAGVIKMNREGTLSREFGEPSKKYVLVTTSTPIWPEDFQGAERIILFGDDTQRNADSRAYLERHVDFARRELHPYLDEDDLRAGRYRPMVQILPHQNWSGSESRFLDQQDSRLVIRVSKIRPYFCDAQRYTTASPDLALDAICTHNALIERRLRALRI
jgi:hypothetical protein